MHKYASGNDVLRSRTGTSKWAARYRTIAPPGLDLPAPTRLRRRTGTRAVSASWAWPTPRRWRRPR
jgi:hypothetical protein